MHVFCIMSEYTLNELCPISSIHCDITMIINQHLVKKDGAGAIDQLSLNNLHVNFFFRLILFM